MNNNRRSGGNIFFTGVFIVVIVILLAMNFKSLISANEYKDKIENLKKELSDLEYENDKLQYELDKALDEDQIRKIAKEELGLVDPDEEHYIVG